MADLWWINGGCGADQRWMQGGPTVDVWAGYEVNVWRIYGGSTVDVG